MQPQLDIMQTADNDNASAEFTPRYAVAKYIPDLWRYEPRNIGVVVWSPDGVVARFLGEGTHHANQHSAIDKRSLRDKIDHPEVYEQWIAYWRKQIAKEAIASFADGRVLVPRQSPEFLDVLRQSGRDNYILTGGGMVLDHVPANNLQRLLADLFAMLVHDNVHGEAPKKQEAKVEKLMKNLLSNTALNRDRFFKKDGVKISLPNGHLPFTFDYAYSPEKNRYERLYQRFDVSAGTKQKNLYNLTQAIARTFDKTFAKLGLQPEQGAVLCCIPEEYLEQAEQADLRGALAELGSVTRVVNIAQPAEQQHLVEDLTSLSDRFQSPHQHNALHPSSMLSH
jgi:hypothetical protein